MNSTIRQQIIEQLKIKPVDAGFLSRALGVTQRAIESHLEHVAQSQGKAFEIINPKCRDCGFNFRKRSRTTKPSRCPMCKGEDIYPPQFYIREKG